MFTVIAIAAATPLAALGSYLALRGHAPRVAADTRGIALQTVIVMVVLLAIAGGVAAVLLTRGGQAVSEMERQNITQDPADIKSESLCEGFGFKWAANACTT